MIRISASNFTPQYPPLPVFCHCSAELARHPYQAHVTPALSQLCVCTCILPTFDSASIGSQHSFSSLFPLQPACREDCQRHVRSFFHRSTRIIMTVKHLPPNEALPGSCIWLWMQAKGMGMEGAARSRRVALPSDAGHLSFGAYLQIAMTADALRVGPRALHLDFARFFGYGRTMVSCCPERNPAFGMALPRLRMPYSLNSQLKQLKLVSAALVCMI